MKPGPKIEPLLIVLILNRAIEDLCLCYLFSSARIWKEHPTDAHRWQWYKGDYLIFTYIFVFFRRLEVFTWTLMIAELCAVDRRRWWTGVTATPVSSVSAVRYYKKRKRSSVVGLSHGATSGTVIQFYWLDHELQSSEHVAKILNFFLVIALQSI